MGIKNVTDHAGATTLIYMLKKGTRKNLWRNSLCH